ncbi:MAG: hypothetical protein ACP5HK_04150 [Acidilobus sp.]
MSTKALGLALIAIAITSLAFLIPANAQTSLPFQVTYNTTRGVIEISNVFYNVGFNLGLGGRAYYWWVNVSKSALLSVIPFNMTKIPTPLIAISSANSTVVELPGPLSNSRWTATQVSSSEILVTYELTANASLTSPFLIRVFESFSSVSPVITYTISVTNLGTSPAYAAIAYGIGAYQRPSTGWQAVAVVPLPNGSLEVEQVANATTLKSPITVVSIEGTSSGPGLVLGLTDLPEGTTVENLEGRVLSLSVNTTYLLAFFRTPLIPPSSNYSVTFEAFATGFNAYELGAAGASLPAYYLYPNYTGAVQRSMGVDNVVNDLQGMISSLNSTISALKEQVNNLSAKVYWYSSQVRLAQRAESYYMEAARRGGILAAGLFVAGIILGVIGGAFFLSPSRAEYVAAKRTKGRGK